MDGFTVFYSDRGNHALEDAKSFQVGTFGRVYFIQCILNTRCITYL